LKLDGLRAVFHALLLLKTLQFLLAVKSRIQKLKIALLLRELGLLTEELLLLVMLDKGKVTLSHEDGTLGFDLLFTFSLNLPLVFEHGALLCNCDFVLVTDSLFV